MNLECNTNRKNEEISLDLNEWQIHKAKLEEIRPWLEKAEKNINIDHVKPITLQLANDWLKNAQVSEAGGNATNLNLIFTIIINYYCSNSVDRRRVSRKNRQPQKYNGREQDRGHSERGRRHPVSLHIGTVVGRTTDYTAATAVVKLVGVE